MNRTSLIAAFTLSFAAAGSAFAESPTPEPLTDPASTTTRAAVHAEVLRAHASGGAHLTEADWNRADPVVSTRSRAEVHAETLAAIASGELQARTAEIGSSAVASLPAGRVAAGVQTARAGT